MQKKWQFPLLLAGLALALGGPATALGAQPEKQVVRMTLEKRPLGENDGLGYGTCQWLYPTNAPREKLLAVPRFRSSPSQPAGDDAQAR